MSLKSPSQVIVDFNVVYQVLVVLTNGDTVVVSSQHPKKKVRLVSLEKCKEPTFLFADYLEQTGGIVL